ncbi:hypothetical protein QBE53_15555 [Vallitaleaceae bacterium 9-2]
MTILDDEARRKLRELNLEDFIDAVDAQSKEYEKILWATAAGKTTNTYAYC